VPYEGGGLGLGRNGQGGRGRRRRPGAGVGGWVARNPGAGVGAWGAWRGRGQGQMALVGGQGQQRVEVERRGQWAALVKGRLLER
jgi:hypothetical protein